MRMFVMKIRMIFTGVVCALLMGVAPLVSADSMSLNRFNHHVLPVLVTVNSQGKITGMSPAYPLRPHMQKLLKTTLSQMITGPATYHGKAISSQSVIKLALKATPQKDGKYRARFAYVGAVPVPYGAWYWNHIDGHRLALVNENWRNMSRPRHRMVFDHVYPSRHVTAPNRVHRSYAAPARTHAPAPQRHDSQPAAQRRSH